MLSKRSKLFENTTEVRRAIMRSVKRKHTNPELAVRKIIRSLGLRFKKHGKKLPGSPDIVFPDLKIALFVHGCFWHRHENCKRSTTPKTNKKFWLEKFDRNVTRDKHNYKELKKLGWKVIVIWECQTGDDKKMASRLKRRLYHIF